MCTLCDKLEQFMPLWGKIDLTSNFNVHPLKSNMPDLEFIYKMKREGRLLGLCKRIRGGNLGKLAKIAIALCPYEVN